MEYAPVDKRIINAITATTLVLIKEKAHIATKYLSPKMIVRATRVLSRGKIDRGNISVLVTVGKPNFRERVFIKTLLAAKEPFPVKKIILKAVPIKKK